MNAVNPNLAMTNRILESEHDYNSDEVYCDEWNQTDDVKPEIYMWDENDIYESEPIVSSENDPAVQVSVPSDQSELLTAVSSPSPTALVVTCTTKPMRQQPTIIVTHACHPLSYSASSVVARVSKAAVLSKIKPTTVAVDGSSGLIFENNAVVVSSENCLC